MDSTRHKSGSATYVNTVTGATYELGYNYSDSETSLERAWQLVRVVAELNNWVVADIKVKTNK